MKKLKDMSLKEKADYIWTYYKFYFIAGILIVALICIFYRMDGKEQKETLLSGVLVNQFLETSVIEEIEADILQALDGDMQIQEVYLDAALSIDLELQDPDTVTNLGKITTYVFAQELDFMIVEPELVEHYAGLNGLAFLEECISKEVMMQLQEKELLYTGTDGRAYGICLEKSWFMEEYGIELENPVLCIVNNSTRKQKMNVIVQWLM